MDVNCRYDRLQKSFYIVCFLCLLICGSGIYTVNNLKNKLRIAHVALETATYEFKFCKYLYKKGLTCPEK